MISRILRLNDKSERCDGPLLTWCDGPYKDIYIYCYTTKLYSYDAAGSFSAASELFFPSAECDSTISSFQGPVRQKSNFADCLSLILVVREFLLFANAHYYVTVKKMQVAKIALIA